MLDKIIPKLLREYMDTDDPARRAELVQVLQDYGAFPRIFEVCDQALSALAEDEVEGTKAEKPASVTAGRRGSRKLSLVGTSDHFVANVD